MAGWADRLRARPGWSLLASLLAVPLVEYGDIVTDQDVRFDLYQAKGVGRDALVHVSSGTGDSNQDSMNPSATLR